MHGAFVKIDTARKRKELFFSQSATKELKENFFAYYMREGVFRSVKDDFAIVFVFVRQFSNG